MKKVDINEFPVQKEYPLVWGEMDAFGHLNNVFYLRLFESIRIVYFEKIDLLNYMQQKGIGPIISRIDCKYIFPLVYPDQLQIGCRIPVEEIKEDRFMMYYGIYSLSHKKMASIGSSEVVAVDYKQNKKTTLPPEWVEIIKKIES